MKRWIFKIRAPFVFILAMVLAGCGTPTAFQINPPASIAPKPPFQPMLVTTLGVHLSPDGTCKVGVTEHSLDLSYLQNGGIPNWSGTGFTPDSHGWTAHPGWFVFIENKSRWWAYDGERSLILHVKTWDESYHSFTGAVYFGTFQGSSGGESAFRADFPRAVPIEVVSRLPSEKQKDVQQHVLEESAEMHGNLIGMGDWSRTVAGLRGRLLIYDDKSDSAANHARIYLELQHVFSGAWDLPYEVYFDFGHSTGLHFEMKDQRGQAIPQQPVVIIGPLANPYWVTLPCDSTMRVRVDEFLSGPETPPERLEIFVPPGDCWIIPPKATNDFSLSATFTASTNHPSALRYHVWKGTLKLPAVTIQLNGTNTSAQLHSEIEKKEVRGQVVDEASHPVPGAAWRISGTEVLREGKWARVIRVGDGLYFFDNFADGDGRFVISYGEPIRFDLQFQKAGYAPAFVYEVAANSPDLKVTLKRGERIHGRVTRNVNGNRVAAVAETVELQLPSQDVWYLEQASTSATGEFEFRACAPPDEPPLPPGNFLGARTDKPSPFERKWQVVCHGKVVQIDVKDGQPIEPVNFELEPETQAESASETTNLDSGMSYAQMIDRLVDRLSSDHSWEAGGYEAPEWMDVTNPVNQVVPKLLEWYSHVKTSHILCVQNVQIQGSSLPNPYVIALVDTDEGMKAVLLNDAHLGTPPYPWVWRVFDEWSWPHFQGKTVRTRVYESK